MEPFIGQITLFGCNFAPYGWMLCQGQLLPIQQYTALFSLLGTYYGGNGTSNFALPDLRGRVAIGMGQGPGLADYVIGESAGAENVSLTVSTMPAHNHALMANTGTAALMDPTGAFVAHGVFGAGHGGGKTLSLYHTGAPNVALASTSLTQAPGSGLPHSNLQPLLGMNWCIAFNGVFPTRP